MKKVWEVVGKLLVVFIFCLAIWLLYDKLRAYSFEEIKNAISQISYFNLFLSFCFMILNYIVLIGYDSLALMAIKKKLNIGRISLVSFVGSVISLNFGALLGGSTVRYRLYSAWGFSPLDIIRLVLMLAVTFWVGAMGLAGLLFIFVPLELPPELNVHLSSVRPLGFILFAICVLYHLLCWKVDGKTMMIRGKEFALPPLKIAILQTIVAGIDLIVAAACLYSLFPSDAGLSFFSVVPNYLLAQVAVVLTHVPGGVGVLEVVIMNLTSNIPSSTVFAAVLMFRVVYYIIPLLFASVLLGINEILLRRKTIQVDSNKQALNDWFLTTMKYTVFVIGILFCLSAIIRIPTAKIVSSAEFSSYFFMFFYLLRSIIGITLIVFAYGLDRKQKAHWNIIVTSLCFGVVAIFVYEGSLYSIGVLAVLFPLLLSKDKFTREKIPSASHYPLHWLITSVTVIGAIILITYASSEAIKQPMIMWSEVFPKSFSPVIVSITVQLITAISIMLILADKVRKVRVRRKYARNNYN